MREIKFRAWDQEGTHTYGKPGMINDVHGATMWHHVLYDDDFVLMQYTGLKDKTSSIYIYEGDIIDKNGLVVGNKYENSNLLKEKTNFLIEGLCTKDWKNTEQEARRRGCNYA